MAKKQKGGIEILESAEALQKEIGKAEGFLNTYQKPLTIVGGVVVALALAFFGYKYYTNEQNAEAQAAMYDSVFYFEQDSLDLALNGTGGNAGLLEIAEDYASTDAGNLANLYVGIIYLNKAEYDKAIDYLGNFSSSDLVLQGRAFCLTGDAYLEKGDAKEAARFYRKAADYKPNKFITPGYLTKLAVAYETAGDTEGALEAYTEIVEKYPTSMEANNAKKYKSMLEAAQ